MKKIAIYILGICYASSVLLTGCIDETFPTDVATGDQLASSAKATEALLWAMPAFANNFNSQGTEAHYDWGYGSIMHIRDVMTEEFAVASSNYDHYTNWHQNQALGDNWAKTQFIWNYYWKFVQTANNMIRTIDPEEANDTQLGYLGAGYGFRAFLYLDMAQMFEFLENDGKSSVNTAGNNVLNLTVPIVSENITEEEARNNPRATRQEMYDFILSDLQAAEEYIQYLNRVTKTLPDLSVIYGLRARLHMWVGEYADARTYARKAIDTGNYTPTSKDQWLNTTTGFNDLSTSSWMWGSQMQSEDDVVQTGILNWTSWSSNETSYGYASAGAYNLIDARFYNQISNDDFRKLSWKAPEGSALEGKNSYTDQALGEGLPEYASLKFRPGYGDVGESTVGSACAYPLMRIEEMYFIEAEAAAHLNATVGTQLLENFMKTYRYSGYVCTASGTDAVVDEIFLQKRIELWGEGISYFDYKRLNKPVTRGYVGTNFADLSRFNTTTRPAWMNFCIVRTEENNNTALVGYNNPDPSDCYTPWVNN
ncbi:MAG: RagB/SusD family nutrient uptake outer membrane protein [Bacteroides sp.]|nr:RagB/SusD family nutrient uptake outer membrane protein [Bacteroides sp.]